MWNCDLRLEPGFGLGRSLIDVFARRHYASLENSDYRFGGSSAAQAQTEVKYASDALGRVISVIYLGGDQDGATIEYTYDKAGNRTQLVSESSQLPYNLQRKARWWWCRCSACW